MLLVCVICGQEKRAKETIMSNAFNANRYREMLDQRLQTIPSFPENRFHGRGIVICGGGNYFPCVWICIRMLRSFGCTLPIELWHRGAREMTDQMKSLVEAYGVVCKDAFAVAKTFPVNRLDGWELKPFAILHSQFAELLYIDADNVVVRNPEFLFDSELFQQTGSLFWPDVSERRPYQCFLKDTSWTLLDMPVRQEAEFESGQLLLDKRRCWGPLQLTLFLNEHSDYYYTAFYGDKDTFHLAWRKLDQEYSIIPHPPGVLGDQFVLIQFDPGGERLFQHRCNAKWTLTGNKRIGGFLFEEVCLAFLRELESVWNETISDMPVTPVEQMAYDEIVNYQTFSSLVDEKEEGHFVFNPNLTAIHRGESYDWMIEEDKDGEPVLILSTDGTRLCFLRRAQPDSWSGLWRYKDQSMVELRPLPASTD